MYFRIIFFIILSWPALYNAMAQNYIGMHKDQVMKTMKETDQYSKLNTSTVNLSYKYLKYEDKIHEITTLYFLSPGDTCTLIRKMYDYSNINDAIEGLNSSFKPDGKNKWVYTENGKTYSVTLVEEDWFFTVTTQLKKMGK